MATSSKKTAKTAAVIDKAGDDYVKALSEFQYRDLHLSRQQVFQLQGGRNDEKLLQLRFITPVKKGTALHQCAECGALFADIHWLEVHGEKWHEHICVCGWQPRPGTLDRETALRRHETQCDTRQQQRMADHKVHVAEARRMQEEGIEDDE